MPDPDGLASPDAGASFDANTEPDGLAATGDHGDTGDPSDPGGLADHADPDGLGTPDPGAPSGANADPDGLSGTAAAGGLGACESASLVGLAGSAADQSGLLDPDGLSGLGDSGTPLGLTAPLRVGRDSVSPLSSAGRSSGPGRLLCAPICTTSSSRASVDTSQADRRPDPVKSGAQNK